MEGKKEVILEARGVTKRFGGVTAADNIDTQFRGGKITGIVGDNGAGKTTFVNIITGYIKPDEGQVYYRGQDITHQEPSEIVRKGITRSFQTPQIYGNLTVLENLLISLAAASGRHRSFWGPLTTQSCKEKAMHLLEELQLVEYSDDLASSLPVGDRKLLDIAMALAFDPPLLFLDEPTSGVSTDDKFEIMDTLVEVLKRSATTTLFIEHDLEVIRRYAQQVLVFKEGKIISKVDQEELSAGKNLASLMEH